MKQFKHKKCIGSSLNNWLTADIWCLSNIGPEYNVFSVSGRYGSICGKWCTTIKNREYYFHFEYESDFVNFILRFG